jgi:hypothetical protein
MTLKDLIQNIVWVLSGLVQLTIVLVMLRRKLHRTFPVFFAYIVFHASETIVAYIVYSISMFAYYWYYWGCEGIDAIFTLAVIQEIFRVMFAPYDALKMMGAAVFRYLTIALCLFAMISAVLSPSGETDRTFAAILVLDRSVQVVQLGLVVFLFAFCRLFGMTWRHYVFGIAAGLAFITSVGTAVIALRTHMGQAGNTLFAYAAPIGFFLGNVLWSYYFASEKSVVPLNIVPRTDQLIAWNQALSRVGPR